MSEGVNQADGEKVSCSLCENLMEDPVSTSCGHSFCRSCIQSHWDREGEEKGTYGCPRCKQVFTQRPEPVPGAALSGIVDGLALASVITSPPQPTCAPLSTCAEPGAVGDDSGCCYCDCCEPCCEGCAGICEGCDCDCDTFCEAMSCCLLCAELLECCLEVCCDCF